MTIKLIGTQMSPFSRKVRVLLAEKGIDFEDDPMMPFGVSDEYKQMHPQGKIPTLVDGDRVIPDSSVICAYLEATHPSPALYPSDVYERARATWYEEFADSGLITGTIPFFTERVVGPLFMKREGDESLIEKAEAKVLPGFFDYLERNLGDADFFVGGRFSIADIALGTQFANYKYGGGSVDAARWPRLAAWVERVHGRPSFKSLIEADQQGLDAIRGANA